MRLSFLEGLYCLFCSVIDINEFRKAVNLVINKEVTYHTPEEFDIAVNMASQELFMDRIGNPNDYQPGRPLPPVGWQITRKVTSDMRPFIVRVENVVVDENGHAQYPEEQGYLSRVDYRHFVNEECEDGEFRKVPQLCSVEIIPDGVTPGRLRSTIPDIKPSLSSPICNMFGDYLQFYPTNLGKVEVTYLKLPVKVRWGYDASGKYAATGGVTGDSIHLEWPETVKNMLVVKTCRFLGINIRENSFIQAVDSLSERGV